MLSKATHLLYLAAIVALAAMLSRPTIQRSAQQPPQKPESGDLVPWLSDLNLASAPQASAPVAPQRDENMPRVLPPPPDCPEPLDEMPGDHRGLRFTPELMSRCVEVAHDIDPELGNRLKALREKNTEEFTQVLREGQIGHRLLAMAQLKQRDPQLYGSKLSELIDAVQVNKVAAQLREAIRNGSAAQAEPLKEQLLVRLRMQLALSLRSRGEYICRLEEQTKKLRDELEYQATHFNSTVEARLQQIINMPDTEGDDALIPAASHEPQP